MDIITTFYFIRVKIHVLSSTKNWSRQRDVILLRANDNLQFKIIPGPTKSWGWETHKPYSRSGVVSPQSKVGVWHGIRRVAWEEHGVAENVKIFGATDILH